VLVAYIVPEDLWYVVPVTVFQKIKGIKLYPAPRKRRSKYEIYREGWRLLSEGCYTKLGAHRVSGDSDGGESGFDPAAPGTGSD
jgi:hypothetical protein